MRKLFPAYIKSVILSAIVLPGGLVMNFHEIYLLVNDKANMDLNSLLKECHAEIIRDNDMMHGFEARSMEIDGVWLIFLKEGLIDIREQYLLLHELGHCYCGSSERCADLFACLYLIKNRIWDACYFHQFLMCNGADRHVAYRVNDEIYRYKLQVQEQIGWRVLELQ